MPQRLGGVILVATMLLAACGPGVEETQLRAEAGDDERGPTTFRSESGTLSVELTVRPGEPHPGELVRFEMQVVHEDAPETKEEPSWKVVHSDDYRDDNHVMRLGPACVSREVPTPTPVRSRREDTIVHERGYRNPGSYSFEVTIRGAARPCSREQSPEVFLEGSLRVEGSTEDVPSNGPVLPVASVTEISYPGDEEGKVHAPSFNAFDRDGYIAREVVDWGDGSQPLVVEHPLEECVAEEGRWPEAGAEPRLLRQGGMLRSHDDPLYGQYGYVEHRYESPEHWITYTVTSTGCDGQDEQTVSVRHPLVGSRAQPMAGAQTSSADG